MAASPAVARLLRVAEEASDAAKAGASGSLGSIFGAAYTASSTLVGDGTLVTFDGATGTTRPVRAAGWYFHSGAGG